MLWSHSPDCDQSRWCGHQTCWAVRLAHHAASSSHHACALPWYHCTACCSRQSCVPVAQETHKLSSNRSWLLSPSPAQNPLLCTPNTHTHTHTQYIYYFTHHSTDNVYHCTHLAHTIYTIFSIIFVIFLFLLFRSTSTKSAGMNTEVKQI